MSDREKVHSVPRFFAFAVALRRTEERFDRERQVSNISFTKIVPSVAQPLSHGGRDAMCRPAEREERRLPRRGKLGNRAIVTKGVRPPRVAATLLDLLNRVLGKGTHELTLGLAVNSAAETSDRAPHGA